MKTFIAIFSTTLTIISTGCNAGILPDKEEIRDIMTKNGYENVSVRSGGDTLFVAYENRVYRLEASAIANIISNIMPLLDESNCLCLICLKRDMPVISVVISKKRYLQYISKEITKEELGKSVGVSYDVSCFKKADVEHNPSLNKFDIEVHPQFHAQFGNFSDPFESQINIAPAVNISFLKGMNITAQTIIPLQNDLNEEGDNVRPGLLTISQTLRIPFNIFTTVTAGYFTRDRYGIDVETKRFTTDGKISLGLRCGYTGQASVLDGRWSYSEVDVFTWFADAGYRFARYDLTLKAGYGKFIAGDRGWRFDVYRRFGEISIGFFAIRSGNISNGGFNFRIPIPPRKYSTKHRIRIRPAGSFAWEYWGKGLATYGKTYDTGNDMYDLSENLNPDYIKNLFINKLSYSP